MSMKAHQSNFHGESDRWSHKWEQSSAETYPSPLQHPDLFAILLARGERELGPVEESKTA
jgi:hypothetical protein